MKKIFKNNTYFKLLMLIIGTSFLFFILYVSLYVYTNKQEKLVYKTTSNRYKNEINSLFELNSKAPTETIIDLTFWDALVKFTISKDQKWFESFIVNEFENYTNVDYLGIYGINKQLIVKTSNSKIKSVDFVPKAMLTKLYKDKFIKFYMKIPEGVVEIFGATIHPSNDPKKNKYKPSGYLFMVRLVDNQYAFDLAKMSSSKVILEEKDTIAPKEDMIQTILPLYDWNKKITSHFVFERPFNLNFKNTKEILTILIIASIFNILIYLYFSRKWVYKPLKLITKVLEKGNEKSIAKLKKEHGEFEYIGNLFEENSNQRNQLEISKKKAEESDKLKSSFLANLSHEIRTPMNAIVGFSDLLNNPDLAESDKAEYLNIIIKSGKNLVSIIEDLLEMSKIDANQVQPKISGISLEECMKELFESIKVTTSKNKEIDFYLIENKNPETKYILTDEIKLKQIIINLVTNAFKYSKKGFVAFGYEIDENNKMIKFQIKDSGIGIDSNNLKLIFDRFRRIEEDYSSEYSGLGLGLSISKSYVEMLGGTINVESEEGIGSVFSFTIPLLYDVETAIKDKKSIEKSTLNNINHKILIAEDDNINYMLLKKILELKNYNIIRAVNGKEAVDCCLNQNIDLVFMDIKMPIMDGYEAFEEIRKFNKSIPIIAQTAHSSIEDKDKILKMGFTNYVTKPIDKEKIFELLDAIFKD